MGCISFGCGFGSLRHLWHGLGSLGFRRLGLGEGGRGYDSGLYLALFKWARGGGLGVCWRGVHHDSVHLCRRRG
jgi:hypothetical protein